MTGASASLIGITTAARTQCLRYGILTEPPRICWSSCTSTEGPTRFPPIWTPSEDIPGLVKGNAVEEVLIAIPSFQSKEIRAVVEIIRNSGGPAKVKILPGILDLMDGNITLSDIKEVRVEDLLGREKVEIDFAAIRAFLTGKRVLITGAGGSIGSELARTVLQFEPRLTALLDIDETELFYLMNRFRGCGGEIVPVIGDIRDKIKMEDVFAKIRPEIVIHSAAYKHVPVLESYPEEAVKTNILGTRILGELALKYKVEKFVYISTDKAINPSSVMGSTKRVGEEMLRILNGRNGTRFISVRFGNVLGSRGSVIPVFEGQIKKGGTSDEADCFSSCRNQSSGSNRYEAQAHCYSSTSAKHLAMMAASAEGFRSPY